MTASIDPNRNTHYEYHDVSEFQQSWPIVYQYQKTIPLESVQLCFYWLVSVSNHRISWLYYKFYYWYSTNTDDQSHMDHSFFIQGTATQQQTKQNTFLLIRLHTFWEGRHWHKILENKIYRVMWASQVELVVKNPLANVGGIRDTGFIPG